MKQLSVSILALLSCFFCFAQSTPQAMNYQAVARTANGQIIPSQNIGVRFSILEATANGTVIYQETQNTTTNNFGLFTLGIGKGTVITGTFVSIPWETGNKFLRVEIAPQGGVNYLLQGSTQLLSVPYALYSERTKLLAGNNTITITGGNTIMGNYQAANNTILVTGNTIAGNYQAANNTVLVTGNTIAGNYQPANNTILVTGNTIAGNYVPANNTILVTGNTIAGNYVPANNTVLVTGNTIAGNYQAANNTVVVTGNTIAGNYQAANNTITVTGNTIAASFQAGAGISITGNVISSVGSSLWIADPTGIHNQSGNVGIRTNSSAANALEILQENSGGTTAALTMRSVDPWHTVYGMLNTSTNPNNRYSWSLGGNLNNNGIGPNNLGLMNHNGSAAWVLGINGATNFVSIGGGGAALAQQPRSRLHIFNGDVNIEEIGSGIILKSPNGNCWRVTIDNAGNLVRTAIVCP